MKSALKGSQKMLQLYTNVTPRGRTFGEVQAAIDRQVEAENRTNPDFAGGNALTVGGSTEPTYTLIGVIS